jgi:cell division transport system permease protein
MSNLFVNLKRILKTGFVTFWRNGAISIATILIMSTTLFVIGSLILGKALMATALDELESRVDITVYFKTDALEEAVLSFKDDISGLDEVKYVEYVSSEKALEEFKARHTDNNLIAQSLEELEENPLGANINIKAKDPSQYESIANFLEKASEATPIIDKLNYRQNKVVIERLTSILDSSRRLGLVVSLVLIFISVFVVFNTIRLAIYISREEISIMRLVGAANAFVRGPFVVEGAMYGIFASIIASILFFPFLIWLESITELPFFVGINLFDYYMINFAEIFLILLAVGVVVGTFSSWIAVRKYLKV